MRRGCLIANSTWCRIGQPRSHFDALSAKGLMMYGQMTAGSWIYIGTQGILQGTYETLDPWQRSVDGLRCKASCPYAGLGGMGGAQPLASP